MGVTAEKPTQLGARVYKKHRAMILKMSERRTKKEGQEVSEAQIVREAIEEKFMRDA